MLDAVIGWFITLMPGIWLFHKFLMPKLTRSVSSVTSATGPISSGFGLLSKLFSFFLALPKFIVDCFSKLGFGRIIELLSKVFGGIVNFKIIGFITMVLSQYFTNLVEKIFLVVGAVVIKLTLIFVKWGKSFLEGLHENYTEELKTILGDSVAQLPPCMVDVMGYMHLVENIGMLVTTLIFVGIVKLIYRFIIKFGVVL